MNELKKKEFEELIRKFDNFNALERIILANEGTVQTLLSVLFSTPIEVKVIYQYQNEDTINRYVVLEAVYGEDLKMPVCFAHSSISTHVNDKKFIEEIWEGKKGIGEIIAERNIDVERRLISVYKDEVFFARIYRILSKIPHKIEPNTNFKYPHIDIYITEVYPRKIYQNLINRLLYEDEKNKEKD